MVDYCYNYYVNCYVILVYIMTTIRIKQSTHDKLKELTNTTLGGRGTYPNGPDVLAINVYKVSGTSVNANLILRWGEAQA